MVTRPQIPEQTESKTVDIALIGLGNVGRDFLRILETKGERLADQYGLAFRVVCVADSSGVAVNLRVRPGCAAAHKEGGGRVAGLPGYQAGQTPAQVLAELRLGFVLEASPVNLRTGEPGLSIVTRRLAARDSGRAGQQGAAGVGLCGAQALAQAHGAGLGYSATVCGALPVVNIGQRDLVAADITSCAASSTAPPTSSWPRWGQAAHLPKPWPRRSTRHRRNRPLAGRGRLGHGQQAGDHRQQRPGHGPRWRMSRCRASRR